MFGWRPMAMALQCVQTHVSVARRLLASGIRVGSLHKIIGFGAEVRQRLRAKND